METAKLECRTGRSRSGYALLLMILVIVVVGVLLWFDPTALFRESDPELPWNQHSRLVKDEEEVEAPSVEQASITTFLMFRADAKEQDARRGKIKMIIGPEGRIRGGWSGEYNPSPDLNYVVMTGGFTGNIDPSKIYKGEEGEDPTLLYFITKGMFAILESNSKTLRTRSVMGDLYVTGWVDPEYNARGQITITSDKRTYEAYSWEAKGVTGESMLGFLR